MLSLFTPTHRPTHLRELYNSIQKQQGNVPYEWVIVPNGACKPDDIPQDILSSPHVRIVPSDLTGIGALKKFACDQCKGDVFVEMDHDDWLAPNAFVKLATAYAETPGGFYYSDFINVKPNGQCETYSARFGWSSYRTTVDGEVYTACTAFEPTARAMCHIFFAPNHVRAWSRAAYTLTGGHDPQLTVGDDHDLVCRTFIQASVPFVWIQAPVYLYRRSSTQSFVEFNKEIQVQQQANCNKYLHQLIEADCKRQGLSMIDVGPSQWAKSSFTPVDLTPAGKKMIRESDNSVGCVRAVDCLQRVHKEKIVGFMNEAYRVLAPGGWLVTSTPSIDDDQGKIGRGAFQDPSHVSYWSANNFQYFTQKHYAGMLPSYTGRFQSVRLWTDYPSEYHKQMVIPYVHADLCALKGQRQPGECHI